MLASCGQENYWNESNKADFLKSCENSFNKSMGESGIDPIEQLGTTAEALCACQLEKTMKQFPDGSPNNEKMKEAAVQTARDCIMELKK